MITDNYGELRLRAAYKKSVFWDEELIAKHIVDETPNHYGHAAFALEIEEHKSPNPKCHTCGIYGLAKPKDAMSIAKIQNAQISLSAVIDRVVVIGAAIYRGTIMLGPCSSFGYGLKAERARIICFFDTFDVNESGMIQRSMLNKMARQLGVPVFLPTPFPVFYLKEFGLLPPWDGVIGRNMIEEKEDKDVVTY
jgi:hypothetical protein